MVVTPAVVALVVPDLPCSWYLHTYIHTYLLAYPRLLLPTYIGYLPPNLPGHRQPHRSRHSLSRLSPSPATARTTLLTSVPSSRHTFIVVASWNKQHLPLLACSLPRSPARLDRPLIHPICRPAGISSPLARPAVVTGHGAQSRYNQQSHPSNGSFPPTQHCSHSLPVTMYHRRFTDGCLGEFPAEPKEPRRQS